MYVGLEKMKKMLIIYPHWVPSNLAGVHRARLIANFLPEFGWHPIVLTVSPEHYEEQPDPDIARTASDKIEVLYSKAYGISRPRLIGDIGLRAFPFLLQEALKLVTTRNIDFIWIPIPSFYTALLGRIIYNKTGTLYGIDYIDPWVRDISNRKNLRSVLSILTARMLEPIAVRRASLISGVSTPYYLPVLQRNFKTKPVAHVGMPYGFDSRDHAIKLAHLTYPWSEESEVEPIVYAGAFLPNAHLFIKALFSVVKTLSAKGEWNIKKKLYFLGTGYYSGTTIAEYAKDYGIEDIVREKRSRYPYLHVLNFLSAAYAVLVVGSTEKHYTASKTYQAILSGKPVFAIFHAESSAVNVLEECSAADFLVKYKEDTPVSSLEHDIREKLTNLLFGGFTWNPVVQALDKYSAKASARALVEKLDEIV